MHNISEVITYHTPESTCCYDPNVLQHLNDGQQQWLGLVLKRSKNCFISAAITTDDFRSAYYRLEWITCARKITHAIQFSVPKLNFRSNIGRSHTNNAF